MPRIPVRTEPYTSPSRQHRHYKNKRDQVLRSLGKAAYINGSHFAIMWVSARGDVDTYASEALKNRLDDWFIKGGVADEAKEMVRAYRNSASAPQIPFASLDYEDDFDDEEAELQRDRFPTDDEAAKDSSLTKQRSVSVTHQSANSTPLLGLDADVFTDENSGERTVDQSGSKAMHNRPKLERSASTSLHHRGNLFRARRPIAPLDTNIANEQQSFARTLSSGVPHTSASGFLPLRSPFRLEGIDSDFSVGPYSAPLRSDLAMPHGMMSVHPAPPSLVKTTLKSAAARTAFLELRFSQLQQGMCKTVAKAWIKVIEPKKQTRCPYNKGDEGKPDWWPEGVRHKEPDHLMKPERHALLLTILRSPRVKVARLQLATAEVVALIKADKVSLLDDVYRIAREEEKMREARMDQETQITVDVSTLEGWSEDEQSIVASERAQSPSASGIDGEEEGMILDSVPRPNSRKRAGGANILQLPSAATNSVRNNKRRLSGSPIINQDADSADAKVEARPPGLGLGLNVTGMPLTSFTSDTAPRKSVKQSGLGISVGRRTNANAQTWLLHEATQHGVQRTSVSSHPMASTSSLSGSSDSRQAAHSESIRHQYGQFGSHLGGLLQEQYGLITPLTGNTQLMDPSFLTAAKDDRYVTGAGAFPLDFQGSSEPRLLDNGYMSAPMSHAHLFPHAAPSFVSDVQHQAASQQSYEHHTHQFSDGAPKSPHLDSFNTLASSATHAIPQQSHVPQNNNTLFASSQEQQSDAQLASGTTTGETGGALGLHGVEGAQWSSSSAVGFGAIQFNHGNDHESWWSGGAIQRAGPALPDHSDASFDASFASTIDSGGPATPPQQSSSALARDTHFAGTSSASGSRANGKFVGAPTPMSKGRSPANLIWSNYGPPQYTENARQNTLAKHSDTSSRSLGAPELASEKETRRYAHPSFAQLAEQQKKQVEVDKQQSDLPIRQNGGATTSSFDNWLYPSQSH